MKLKTLSMLVIATGGLASTSHAAQIAYEGFNYPVSTVLSNVSGGSGWIAPWTGANFGAGPLLNEFIVANGLNWTNTSGGYIVGLGNSIIDNDPVNNRQSFRQWFYPSVSTAPTDDYVTTTWGTNIWFSFLATYDVASGSGGSVCIFETTGNNTDGAGVAITGPAGGGNFVIQLRAPTFGQGAHSGTTANLTGVNGTNLVVGRFQLVPGGPSPSAPFGNDRLDVWLNQTTEPITDSDLYFTGFWANRAGGYSDGLLGMRTGGGCEMTIDELRIGTTFADVVPSTAKSPNPKPAQPLLTLEKAGSAGLQFNTSEATPTNSNEIVSYYATNSSGTSVPIECTWVGKGAASYSFTVATPPASGPSNFMAYVWLIPNWNGHIQALDNPNAVQLALISDGHSNAKAVLGYYVNSSGTVQDNLQTLVTSGVLCSIASAPFAGTWTISVSGDRSFTITAPNGAHASGSLVVGDESYFASNLKFFLGISPNGNSNVGNPALGCYMTVSGLAITNSTDGTVVQADWTTGQPLLALNPPNFLISANFPSCIYVTPSNSVYRATWQNAAGPGIGANSLVTTNILGGSAPWTTAVPLTSTLSDSTNVIFITSDYLTNSAGYFRVSIPYSPF